MKQIVCVSLGSSQRDYVAHLTVLGQRIHVRRIGVNGDSAHAAALMQQYDGTVHALCLEGANPVAQVGEARYPNPVAAQIVMQAQYTPVLTGSVLRETLERWAIKCTADQLPSLFQQRRVLMLCGVAHYHLAQALETYAVTLRFADPVVAAHSMPLPIPHSLRQLERYAAVATPVQRVQSWRTHQQHRPSPPHPAAQAEMRRLLTWADVIIGDCEILQGVDSLSLTQRTVITDDPSPAEIDAFRQQGVATLVTMTPPLSRERPFVSMAVLEAIITVVQESSRTPNVAEALDFISAAKWEPTIQHLNQRQAPATFAFVIHPLTTAHIYNDRRFGFARYLPQRLVEWVGAYVPPLYLSRMRGIRSRATGQEVEGLLFTLGATSRQLMRHSPEFAYRRLGRAAQIAERRGAKILGLGAFTSVVGDAGVTVAQQSAIGVTSGNSLTVAATLEAAKRAIIMMGGRTDQGRAVIIGATGSIGAVCARLLAQAIHDVVLVAPRPERLLALKQVIEQETPAARVVVTTDAADVLGDADLIITTTSALTGKVLAIDMLKPGAVVCDVARPSDVREEDAARRPDVLVIESGEILLPGNPDFGFDIDLPAGTAYACLAETALLTMEGKFGDYTLGRTIEIEQVKEMYRLMQKHGLELAGLRSFGRYITPEDIAEKRRLAAERRGAVALPLQREVVSGL